MNLHGLVRSAIGQINPHTMGTIQPSAGSTTAPDGKRVPAYGPAVTVPMQVQALETRDLMQLDGLNVQGSTHKVYLDGDLEAIVRVSQRGGDLVTLPNGQVFLTTVVLEAWPNWTSAAVTLQAR